MSKTEAPQHAERLEPVWGPYKWPTIEMSHWPEDNSWALRFKDFPAVMAAADTRDEAFAMLLDAATDALEAYAHWLDEAEQKNRASQPAEALERSVILAGPPQDLAGRSVMELLVTAADVLDANGGGPLADCLREMGGRMLREVGPAAYLSALSAPGHRIEGWRCAHCGAPAVCFGSYEGYPSAFACTDCCGHGNEDGECVIIVHDVSARSAFSKEGETNG